MTFQRNAKMRGLPCQHSVHRSVCICSPVRGHVVPAASWDDERSVDYFGIAACTRRTSAASRFAFCIGLVAWLRHRSRAEHRQRKGRTRRFTCAAPVAAREARRAGAGRDRDTTLSWAIRSEDEAALSPVAQLHFERAGFLCAPELLTVPEVSALASELHKVQRTETCELAALRHEIRSHLGAAAAASCASVQECRERLRPLELRGKVKFLQYFNLHRASPELRSAALSPRLGLFAAKLLGVPRVRLYQDSLFMKRVGDGPTRWHSDLGLTPFDTNALVTVWLALTPVPAVGGSGLRFAHGSHHDYALPYHSDLESSFRQEDLNGRYDIEECGGLRPGDATFHHGWTLHCAGQLDAAAKGPRVAWAVSYVADGAKLLPRRSSSLQAVKTSEDSVSFEPWVDEIPPDVAVDHPLVPLVPLPDVDVD